MDLSNGHHLGYTKITSNFGYRNAPANGASTFHSGIDIGAPSGSNIISSFSGIVTYTDFKGANGYTIIIENENFSAYYCHVSPNFIVKVGDWINKGEIIGHVGPKNIYNVLNNPYKDNQRKPHKRSNHWSSLTFYFKKRWKTRKSPRLFIKLHIIIVVIIYLF